jgi:low temperature requirement protein LtrA
VIDQELEREQRVSPLELFFDLVFVFAFTQVTTVLSDNLVGVVSDRLCCSSPRSGGRGLPTLG